MCHGADVALPPKEVGKRIREAKNAKGWTAKDLAERMGSDVRTVQRWMAGVDARTGKPTLPRVGGSKGLFRLAEVLEVPVGYLVELPDPVEALRLLREENEELKARLATVERILEDRGYARFDEDEPRDAPAGP
jgi:transcriptional regulator with XRE-family HTH domain